MLDFFWERYGIEADYSQFTIFVASRSTSSDGLADAFQSHFGWARGYAEEIAAHAISPGGLAFLDWIVLSQSRITTDSTLFAHEYTHVLQHHLGDLVRRNAPAWLDEGGAVWIEHLIDDAVGAKRWQQQGIDAKTTLARVSVPLFDALHTIDRST